MLRRTSVYFDFIKYKVKIKKYYNIFFNTWNEWEANKKTMVICQETIKIHFLHFVSSLITNIYSYLILVMSCVTCPACFSTRPWTAAGSLATRGATNQTDSDHLLVLTTPRSVPVLLHNTNKVNNYNCIQN